VQLQIFYLFEEDFTMSKNDYKRTRWTTIQEEERKLKQRRRQLMAECDHRDPETGKLAIKAIDDRGNVRCKICGMEFNSVMVNESELNEAIDTLHNSIQQIRSYSGSKEDRDLIIAYGKLDADIETIAEQYGRVIRDPESRFNKKKKKKHKHNDYESFGFYGADSVSYGGGGRSKGWR
jgi:transcription elongation factor Elf1